MATAPHPILVTGLNEDAHWLNNIQKWINKGRIKNVVLIQHMENPEFDRSDLIKAHLTEYIKEARVIFVLIGDRPHLDFWLDAYVELATTYETRMFCMRVPQTTTPKPEELRKYKEISFNPNTIIKALKSATQAAK